MSRLPHWPDVCAGRGRSWWDRQASRRGLLRWGGRPSGNGSGSAQPTPTQPVTIPARGGGSFLAARRSVDTCSSPGLDPAGLGNDHHERFTRPAGAPSLATESTGLAAASQSGTLSERGHSGLFRRKGSPLKNRRHFTISLEHGPAIRSPSAPNFDRVMLGNPGSGWSVAARNREHTASRTTEHTEHTENGNGSGRRIFHLGLVSARCCRFRSPRNRSLPPVFMAPRQGVLGIEAPRSQGGP